LLSIPHRAIWDDHDYGPNDSDSSFVYRKESQQIFARFWKETPTKLNKYGDLRWLERRGNLLIVGLDNRSHRGPVGTQMLGSGQLHWLESVLLEHQDATVVVVAVGSQVLNEAHVFENYVRFPERKLFLELLDRAPQKRVVLLTGDRHHSETNRLLLPSGKMLVEYTSSALSSKLFAPTPKEVEANIHLDSSSIVTDYNYGLLELDGSGNLRAAYLDRKGRVLWEEHLTP
jgi:alkaline phosphatase D